MFYFVLINNSSQNGRELLTTLSAITMDPNTHQITLKVRIADCKKLQKVGVFTLELDLKRDGVLLANPTKVLTVYD